MDYQAITEKIKSLPDDLRLEVILGELFANGLLRPEDIQIEPRGNFERGHRFDLLDVKPPEKESEKFRFEISREGIFDASPKGLFYQRADRKYQKKPEEIKRENEKRAKEEKAARDFFLPIEQEFYRNRLALEEKERAVFTHFSDANIQRLLLREFWELDLEVFAPEQRKTFLYLLPYTFHFKGDLNKVEKVFRLILRQEVQLKLLHGRIHEFDREKVPGLGEHYLGISSVLGHTLEDGIPYLELRILNPELEDLPHFLPEYQPGTPGGLYRVIQFIQRFFLPCDVDLEVEIELREEDRFFKISEAEQDGRLGYSTFLSLEKA